MIDKRIKYRVGGASGREYDQGGSRNTRSAPNMGGGGGRDASTTSFDRSINPNRPGGPIGRDDSNAPSAYEMIGGEKFNVTPDTRDERERARVKTQIMFAPTKTNPFSFKNIAKNVVLGIVAPQLLGPKFAAGMSAYNTAKTISNLAKTIGLTDTNVIDAFTSNLTNKLGNINTGRKPITTTSLDEDLSKGGGGLESLGNIDALNEEYLLLLNKFNSGVFTDADQIRFTFLKNMLGK